MPDSLISVGCIQANPDIAGIGVRVAIYAQNFIALILSVVALGDRYVSWKELLLLESQSMTILLTACALLSSAVIQAATFGMSTYHALIILNLAWMNNTNTLLYAILFRYQGLVKIPGFRLSTFQPQKPLPKKKALPLLTIGSLHLSFVAGFGLWFWAKIDTFGASSQCTPRLPLLLVILGHRIPVTSQHLRVISMSIYGIIAIPGLNLVVVVGVLYGTAAVCSWAVEILSIIPKNVAFFLPGYITLALLIGFNIATAVDTEIMISQTKAFVQEGESQWTFGQTLAIFMLVLPLKDIVFCLLGENKELSKYRERIDEERAIYHRNWERWISAWPDTTRPNVVPAPPSSVSLSTNSSQFSSSCSQSPAPNVLSSSMSPSVRPPIIHTSPSIPVPHPQFTPSRVPVTLAISPSTALSPSSPTIMGPQRSRPIPPTRRPLLWPL